VPDISLFCFFCSSRRRHTRSKRDWSSDVCSSDLGTVWQLVGKNTDPRALASGLIPGLFCLISSLISRGQMGAGDGLVVCAGGIRSEERRVGEERRYPVDGIVLKEMVCTDVTTRYI